MIDIRGILKQMIVDEIDYTYTINEIEEVSPGVYKLHTCDTMHLRPDKTVTVDGNTYTIDSFVINSYIQVSGAAIDPSVTSFEAYPFTFESGTLKDTMAERTDAKEAQEAEVPFFWLRYPVSGSDEFDEGDLFSTLADLNFYLCDESIPVGDGEGVGGMWETENHDVEVIKPMRNFYEKRIVPYFRDYNNLFGDIESINVRELPSIGAETENGNIAALFNEPLSGIGVRVSLPFYAQGCKKCLTN